MLYGNTLQLGSRRTCGGINEWVMQSTDGLPRQKSCKIKIQFETRCARAIHSLPYNFVATRKACFGSPRRCQVATRAISGDEEQPSNSGKLREKLVAYQGFPGAYSEMAANAACPGYTTLPCEQFEVAFQALTQWSVDRAVLPVENSLGGSIHTVYDLLQRYNLHIVGETLLGVNHCLLALPGVEIKDVTKVLSHPQALAQTEGYIRGMPGVAREAVDDTAGAAKFIADNKIVNCAAIASKKAAELYGLNILDENIQDMKDNFTRFVVLSRDPLHIEDPISENYKTSIVFSLEEGPGVLFKALSVFALRDIDLSKIESRPLREQPIVPTTSVDDIKTFNYLFYVDFVGNLNCTKCQNAMRHLSEFAPYLRVLGSYPRYQKPV